MKASIARFLLSCAASVLMHAPVFWLASFVVASGEPEMEPIEVSLFEPPPPPLGAPGAPEISESPSVPEPPQVKPPAQVEDATSEEPANDWTGEEHASAGTPVGEPDGVEGGITGGEGDEPMPANRAALPPAVLTRVKPDYPSSARARGIEGSVVLRAIVDRRGRIEEPIAVVESVSELDAAAIAAVRRWSFRPAEDPSGEPIRVVLEIPIRFVLR